MALSDVACRNADKREKDYKIHDEKGLYLLLTKAGGKLWRCKYRFGGKEKLLSFGPYPEISLKDARRRRDQAREQMHQGVDPAAEKQRKKAEARTAALGSFEQVARAWHVVKAKSLTARYVGQVMDRLEADVFPKFGSMPIRDITPPIVLDAIRSIEERGAKEMAHRVRMHVSDIFVWAIASGITEQDPAAVIRKALEPTNGKLRPAMIKIHDARSVLIKSEALKDIWWATRLTSRLLALTAARPGVVRVAERHEFEDLDGLEPVWRIPAIKMKLTRERKRDASFEFVMPLSHQAVAVVKAAMTASPSDNWLFPDANGWRKPISDSTLSKHYRDAGFTGQHVPHGWRSSFSTIMNEQAAIEDRERDREIIDLMLAHVAEGVEAAYNRAAYMPRRRELAQAWANMLMKDLQPPSELIPTILR